MCETRVCDTEVRDLLLRQVNQSFGALTLVVNAPQEVTRSDVSWIDLPSLTDVGMQMWRREQTHETSVNGWQVDDVCAGPTLFC